MKKLKIIKIGGKMIDDPSKLNRILDAFVMFFGASWDAGESGDSEVFAAVWAKFR